MSLTTSKLPEARRRELRARLGSGSLVRAIEFHDPLSAMLGEAASAEVGGEVRRFDLLWASGFSHAAALGLPDIGAVWLERRLDTIADAAAVTGLPMLVDCGLIADPVALGALCQRLESMGVAAAMIEDKKGAKRTSLADQVDHELEDPQVFAQLVAAAREALLAGDMMVFARTEALIAGRGLDEALHRAEVYLRSSADGLVIHSKDRSGKEILAFLDGYRDLQARVGIEKPLVCIPTLYNHIADSELFKAGASIVIHANHMIRAAFKAMEATARDILAHDRSLEADAGCVPLPALIAAVERGEQARATEALAALKLA